MRIKDIRERPVSLSDPKSNAGISYLQMTASAVAIETVNFEFMKWIQKFGKSYKDAKEFEMRFANWLEMDKFIKETNADET